MTDKIEEKLCPSCNKMKPVEEVYERNCGYSEEINGTIVRELICNDCEHEHLMDI